MDSSEGSRTTPLVSEQSQAPQAEAAQLQVALRVGGGLPDTNRASRRETGTPNLRR
ncbi:hypothetical protein J2Z49_001496 [Desulfofundulus luciae]|uniref:Uncharacterized protein n=1 Tax=Desulfofundulus luciae TaxID=74702 RepID=A0ABU0B0Z6_9FIRM|nr:hypothetical protein [Desulfofundulus luciae]